MSIGARDVVAEAKSKQISSTQAIHWPEESRGQNNGRPKSPGSCKLALFRKIWRGGRHQSKMI